MQTWMQSSPTAGSLRTDAGRKGIWFNFRGERRLGDGPIPTGVGEPCAAATEILPRFRGEIAQEIRHKTSSFDLVTDADEAAEAAISAALHREFPIVPRGVV